MTTEKKPESTPRWVRILFVAALFFVPIGLLSLMGSGGSSKEPEIDKMVVYSEYPDKRWPFRASVVSLHCEMKKVGHLTRPHAWVEDGDRRYALNGPASYDGTPFVLDSAPDMDADGDGEVTKAEGDAWSEARNVPMDLTERALVQCDYE